MTRRGAALGVLVCLALGAVCALWPWSGRAFVRGTLGDVVVMPFLTLGLRVLTPWTLRRRLVVAGSLALAVEAAQALGMDGGFVLGAVASWGDLVAYAAGLVLAAGVEWRPMTLKTSLLALVLLAGCKLDSTSGESVKDMVLTMIPAQTCTADNPLERCFDITHQECLDQMKKAINECAVEQPPPATISVTGPEGKEWGRKLGMCAGMKYGARMAGKHKDGCH